ncbi:hypothetical protein OIV83_000137 [Microbotryomycetes sp. JL201]|nr:hypothetical protein OIV83_000137 [Microbotryomycetes sp. JL201]
MLMPWLEVKDQLGSALGASRLSATYHSAAPVDRRLGTCVHTSTSKYQDKLNIQKKQHRERAQPVQRQKLGLLEKHKDYVKRARDFHSKEARLQKLREKAAMRNKDEFYFGMIKSKTIKGVHVQSRGNEALPTDLVKVLKTQDAGYIRTQRAMEESRVRRLQQQLNSLIDDPSADKDQQKDDTMDEEDDLWDSFDEPVASTSSAPATRKHIVFTSDLDAVRSADPAQILKQARSTSKVPTVKSAASIRKGKGKASQAQLALEQERQAQLAQLESEIEKESKTHRQQLEQELEARQQRLRDLSRAMRELEMQRALMGKGAKQVVQPKKDNKTIGGEVNDWSLGDQSRERSRVPEGEEGAKFKTPRKR